MQFDRWMPSFQCLPKELWNLKWSRDLFKEQEQMALPFSHTDRDRCHFLSFNYFYLLSCFVSPVLEKWSPAVCVQTRKLRMGCTIAALSCGILDCVLCKGPHRKCGHIPYPCSARKPEMWLCFACSCLRHVAKLKIKSLSFSRQGS